jgi:hypothetical protein
LRPSEVRARIIDGSRSKNGNLGLAFGGIRHRIVGSLRKEHLNIGSPNQMKAMKVKKIVMRMAQ